MNDSKSALYSLIPLILIILFSWLFGLLGSKLKKPPEEGEVGLKSEPEDKPIDLFGEMMQQVGRGYAGGNAGGNEQQAPPAGVGVTRIQKGLTGPTVTPKPITPKWWGA
ncbi:MAG: hypothetical protein WBG50_16085 [Desulfomonilaceae bacterium]